MGASIFKQQKSILAAREKDLRFYFTTSNYLRHILIKSNKVIEMRENGLLDQEKLKNYTAIHIIHDNKLLKIPIVVNSWKYIGQKDSILRVTVLPNLRLRKKEMHNWHLQLERR